MESLGDSVCRAPSAPPKVNKAHQEIIPNTYLIGNGAANYQEAKRTPPAYQVTRIERAGSKHDCDCDKCDGSRLRRS